MQQLHRTGPVRLRRGSAWQCFALGWWQSEHWTQPLVWNCQSEKIAVLDRWCRWAHYLQWGGHSPRAPKPRNARKPRKRWLSHQNHRIPVCWRRKKRKYLQLQHFFTTIQHRQQRPGLSDITNVQLFEYFSDQHQDQDSAIPEEGRRHPEGVFDLLRHEVKGWKGYQR